MKGDQKVKDYLSREVTSGPLRTMVVEGVIPKEKGKWISIFIGNGNLLTQKATDYLKEQGLIE